MQLSPRGPLRGRSGQSRHCRLVLGAETSELLYKIQLGLGTQRAGSGSLGKRRWKWVGERGRWRGENSSLQDGPAGSVAKSRIRSTSWLQGAVGTTGERTCDHEVPEDSPVRCPLTSLSACFWLQDVILPETGDTVSLSDSSGRRRPGDPAAGTGVDGGPGGPWCARLMGVGLGVLGCGRPRPQDPAPCGSVCHLPFLPERPRFVWTLDSTCYVHHLLTGSGDQESWPVLPVGTAGGCRVWGLRSKTRSWSCVPSSWFVGLP